MTTTPEISPASTGSRGSALPAPPGTGHGWWPYLGPYLVFMLAVEVAGRLPAGAEGFALFLKPLAPLLVILYHWQKGAYPELRSGGLTVAGASQDIAVGIALTALWLGPYVFFDSLRMEDPTSSTWLPDFLRADTSNPFNPEMLGSEAVLWVLAARMFGYALVTPLFEELFIRSFVMRYSEVYWERGDFRNVPLAHYSLRSFVSTTIIFTIGHVPWEWWVAIPWVVLSNIWFYKRKNLWALILVHGVTNGALLLLAIFGGNLFNDGSGRALSLWFFV